MRPRPATTSTTAPATARAGRSQAIAGPTELRSEELAWRGRFAEARTAIRRARPPFRRSWSYGWNESPGNGHKGNDNSKIGGGRSLAGGEGRWLAEGHWQGTALGVPVDRLPQEWSALDVLRIVGGRVAERWSQGNALSLTAPVVALVVFLIARMPQADCIVKLGAWRNPFLRRIVSIAGYIANADGPAVIDACVQRP